MQDADLLVSLAEIAGVFVGFGALISVTRNGASEAFAVTYIRGVVWVGLMVVVAALVPVVIGRYGIGGHDVWLTSSLLVLALYWVMVVVNNRMPEHRALLSGTPRAVLARSALPALLLDVLLHVALVLVVLGTLPDQEPALYISAVVLLLFEAAFYLVTLVYSLGRPAAW